MTAERHDGTPPLTVSLVALLPERPDCRVVPLAAVLDEAVRDA